MPVLPKNAYELEASAREIGADVLAGRLRYPSETGGWQLGELDLDEYLARYRGRRLILIIAPVGAVEPVTFTCVICGFVMDRARECMQSGGKSKRRRAWPFATSGGGKVGAGEATNSIIVTTRLVLSAPVVKTTRCIRTTPVSCSVRTPKKLLLHRL